MRKSAQYQYPDAHPKMEIEKKGKGKNGAYPPSLLWSPPQPTPSLGCSFTVASLLLPCRTRATPPPLPPSTSPSTHSSPNRPPAPPSPGPLRPPAGSPPATPPPRQRPGYFISPFKLIIKMLIPLTPPPATWRPPVPRRAFTWPIQIFLSHLHSR